MENKPSFDRGLIPPLLFGAFSLFGICLVLLLLRLSPLRSAAPIQSTNTAFDFLLLGTEPGFTTLTPEPEEGATEVPTGTPAGRPTARATSTSSKTTFPTSDSDDGIISLASPTRSQTPASPPTPSATPTTASAAPLNSNSYDDTDARLDFTGSWILQNNVTGVFKNTLHVSNTLDNFVTFRFIGEQVRIFYQSGSGLGTIRINIDGLEYDLDESADVVKQTEWPSPSLINGTHTVTIVHLSGGSVNLDMIIIPDIIKTATPTP